MEAKKIVLPGSKQQVNVRQKLNTAVLPLMLSSVEKVKLSFCLSTLVTDCPTTGTHLHE